MPLSSPQASATKRHAAQDVHLLGRDRQKCTSLNSSRAVVVCRFRLVVVRAPHARWAVNDLQNRTRTPTNALLPGSILSRAGRFAAGS